MENDARRSAGNLGRRGEDRFVLFCSPYFVVFFLAVFTAYWAIPWNRARVLLLLAASLYFYASWNHWLAILLCVSTVIDFGLAQVLERSDTPRLRKFILAFSVIANVILLGYFKYANFFFRSLEQAAGEFGFTASLPVLRVILPIGISFYTFEAINYMVDVYRGKVRAARDLDHFMLFILFFPHLLAGPIVRARDFLPLIARRKRWSWLRCHAGLMLILLGVVKKMAIADRMPGYVDPVFDDPGIFSTATLWMAAAAYAIQVYCDFSGYSDMAIGLAHLLGYHLALNFNMPFLAPNPAAFWRRWHISLSTWIRDYLFIPLGGNRISPLRTDLNVLLTFTLCGLWHGAGWNFVLWGTASGVLLVLHGHFKPWCDARPWLAAALTSAPGTGLRIAATFATFCLTLVIFRCPTLPGSWTMLTRMMLPSGGLGLTVESWGLYATFALVAVGHLLGQRDLGRKLWDRLPAPVAGLGYGAALAAALVVVPGVSKAFIYFQF
jgi:alginate O-acetyltransferase complex protein AlgI